VSTYKKEVGTAVQNNAGDYTGAVEGQLWYNSTDKSFQFRSISTAGAWSTGGNMNTAISNLMRAGTQTAALKFGGRSPNTGATEEYDGTSWTEVNDMNTARSQGGGSGTQTSALVYAGETPDNTRNLTESWNGTSWTVVNTLNTA